MNIFHTLILKIAGTIAAIVVFVSGAVHDVPAQNQISISSPDVAASVVAEKPQTSSVATDSTTTEIDVPVPDTTAQSQKVVPVSVPVYIIQPQPQVQTPQVPATVSAPLQTQVQSTPTMDPHQITKIDIINPIGMKGTGRELQARAEPKDELNQVYIGAVVTTADGSNERSADVSVTCTDSSQNKTIKGTGDFTGAPQNVYYYPFTYDIHTTGEHTITFTAGGVSQSVSFNVEKEDTRQ